MHAHLVTKGRQVRQLQIALRRENKHKKRRRLLAEELRDSEQSTVLLMSPSKMRKVREL